MTASTAAAAAPTARDAYDHIAVFYDGFTAHHDYELWLGNLLQRAASHGLPSTGNLLDVACGTGNSFLPMLRRGWRVTAAELSPAMAAQARAKAPTTQVEVADMRDLPRLGVFDLVWCLDDAVNYLTSVGELEQALEGMASNLATGALLVFDLNTLLTYRTFFAEAQIVEVDGARLLWRGRGDGKVVAGGEYEAEFHILPAAGPPTSSLHRQRHFTVGEIESCLSQAGLQLLDLCGHHFDAVLEQPLDEDRHTKAIVFACKQDHTGR